MRRDARRDVRRKRDRVHGRMWGRAYERIYKKDEHKQHRMRKKDVRKCGKDIKSDKTAKTIAQDMISHVCY